MGGSFGRVTLLAGLVLASPLVAQNEPQAPLAARHFEVKRAEGAIQIDGKLDDAGWRGAVHWDVPYEWQPGDNIRPPVDTEFYLAYDENYLYAAWHCADPEPQAIRAHLMDRDSINTFVQDDHVLLLIDTFNDERRAYQFRVNPLGVQADAFNAETEGVEDWSFDLIWDSAARITAEGWDVEIAIPFSQIRFASGSGPQTWGFDVGRSWPRSVRHRMAAWPRDRSRNCGLCQIDKVSGFEGMKVGLGLEITPTLTGHRTEERASFPDGPFETADGRQFDPGLSARWGITSSLSLNAAINPDFSQVEADAAQLDVNERFALFYEEKRPFFLEGADFFATPIDAVFTRTVVDPDWGLKLTGKQGGNALGAFVARDNHNALIFPGNQFSRQGFLEDQHVDSGVFRYRRDILSNSTIGVLYAGRQGDDYANDVFGLDTAVRIDDSNDFRLQYLRSGTEYPDAVAAQFDQPHGRFDGDALYANYTFQSRNWLFLGTWEDRDERFRADSGFVPQVDIRRAVVHGQRTFWGEAEDWYDVIRVDVDVRRTEDHDGQLTEQKSVVTGTYQGPWQSLVQAEVQERKEYFGGRLFEGLSTVWGYVEMQPGAVAKFSLYLESGDAIDTFNVQVGDNLVINPTVELKLGRHVNLQLQHVLSRLDVPGGELFEANLSQLRLVYNFNVRAFVRAIVQYQDIRRDPLLFPVPVERQSKSTFSQLLFSYKLNPQTVLFLGYSDNYAGFDGVGITQTDRTFFAKVGYAILR